VASAASRAELERLMKENPADKVERVLQIFRDCKVSEWAQQLKEKFVATGMKHFHETAVMSNRKEPLQELALFLTNRTH
jgi:geranylgeranyl diphosphate synthase type II